MNLYWSIEYKNQLDRHKWQSSRQQFLLSGGVPLCVVSDRHASRRDRSEGQMAYVDCARKSACPTHVEVVRVQAKL